MSDKLEKLTSGRRIARNVVWNLLGTAVPLLVAIVAIPVLIEGLGVARFGVLTLAWMVVGYFSLFDLGLGRALTKLVAEKLGRGRTNEIPALTWTAIILMAILGVLGASFLAVFSPWLVGTVLKIPSELQYETLTAFYLLASSVPIVISATGFRGILEAHQRFELINAIRIPLGILTFLGPIVVLPFSHSLVPVVASLVIARLVSCFAFVVLCLHVDPSLRHLCGIHLKMVKPLICFGGWMTVTNIVSPLMVYLDRILIGTVISITAVAYYVTPYEIVTKLSILPSALMAVMFPAFSAAVVRDRVRAVLLFNQAIKYNFLALFPIVLVVVTFAQEGLSLWISSDFATHSTSVLQLLAFGVFINSFARVPFGLIQSLGRPDLTAKLHLIELPFYLLLLWFAIGAFGIIGVAITWSIRIVFDTFSLFLIAQRLFSLGSTFSLQLVLLGCMALCTMVLGAIISNVVVKVGFLLLVLFSFAAFVWLVFLDVEEKNLIHDHLRAILFRS